MKIIYRSILIIGITLILLILVSCPQENPSIQQENPSINAINLTENEKELFSAVGVERYFVFDIELTSINLQSLGYRVNHYENGELV